MGKDLTVDLHEVFNRSEGIEKTLREAMEQAVERRLKTVEIIPGKGSGQLKKRVIRFLEQKEVKALYHRYEKDSKNFGGSSSIFAIRGGCRCK